MPDTPQPAAPANGAIPNAGANGASPPSRRDDQSSFSVSVGQVYDGPLDLLLDLIRKQDIDIYDIPIARITAQYLTYVETMKGFDVDVAAEFIYTASLLIHIKSKMLLPRDPAGPASEEDPRMELVNRLLEHERFKTAAQMLLQKQQIEENVWSNPSLRNFAMPRAPSRSWPLMSSTWSRRFSRSSIELGDVRRSRSTKRQSRCRR